MNNGLVYFLILVFVFALICFLATRMCFSKNTMNGFSGEMQVNKQYYFPGQGSMYS